MNDNVYIIPDTEQRSPVGDGLIREVLQAATDRRRSGDLSFDERLAIPCAANDTIAALARRGWLTREAWTALGIPADYPNR